MRIGIEAQRILRKEKHGMDIVILELIKALQISDKFNDYFIFVKKGDDEQCLQETINFKIVNVPGVSYLDWEQISLPLIASRYNLDILHCSSNTAPLLYRGKTILTLHDIIFLEPRIKRGTFTNYQFLGRIYRKFIVPRSVKNAKHIITPSEYERKRISSILRINNQDISVVYNSYGNHFNEKIKKIDYLRIKVRYNLPDNYIFYIGNTDPKKNIYNTILAYKKYCINAIDPLPLVIADIDEDFLEKILTITRTKSLRHNIFRTNYILNSDLPGVYAGAKLFLYPSLRESFGIPILESMVCGIPVIASNATAIPEVAGEAALFIDPNDAECISDAITQILTVIESKTQLIENGYERIKHFSWTNSADKLLNIYKTV